MRQPLPKALFVATGLALYASTAGADSASCDAANQNYQELRSRLVMDESGYAATLEAEAVRVNRMALDAALVPLKANQSQLSGARWCKRSAPGCPRRPAARCPRRSAPHRNRHSAARRAPRLAQRPCRHSRLRRRPRPARRRRPRSTPCSRRQTRCCNHPQMSRSSRQRTSRCNRRPAITSLPPPERNRPR